MSVETSSRERIGSEEYEGLARTAAQELTPELDVPAMETVFNLIRAANRIMKDLEVKVHRPQGISFAGYQVLFSIRAVGQANPNQLARLASVSTASMTSLLHTMERNGWVWREPDPDDGRRSIVRLTEEGEQLISELVCRNHKRERQWGQALTPVEAIVLAELMRKLLMFHPDRADEEVRA